MLRKYPKIKIIKFPKNIKDNAPIIILDVFRASSTMYYLYNTHIKNIYPVSSIKEALNLSKTIDKSILIGEEKGKKIKTFDYGNSPTEIKDKNFKDYHAIMRTSSGTVAINYYKSNIILIGSLLNAEYLAKYIIRNNYHKLYICVTNNKDKNKYNEDYICAKYISSLIKNKKYNINKKIKRLERYKKNRFFKKELQKIFPKSDFYLSTKINIFKYILVFNGNYIERKL